LEGSADSSTCQLLSCCHLSSQCPPLLESRRQESGPFANDFCRRATTTGLNNVRASDVTGVRLSSPQSPCLGSRRQRRDWLEHRLPACDNHWPASITCEHRRSLAHGILGCDVAATHHRYKCVGSFSSSRAAVEVSCASTEAQDLGTPSPTKTRAGKKVHDCVLRLLSCPGLGMPSDEPAPKRFSSAGILQMPIRRQTRDFGYSTICRMKRTKQSALSCWPLSMLQS
jgi:hypothetical protein